MGLHGELNTYFIRKCLVYIVFEVWKRDVVFMGLKGRFCER
ncbi:hypothetical protein PCIT_a1620 [Pseudoalteromonas citrea]|uniref:Uncharacterized protein n=1 Tax=Pseudoalteromonas citrea TaxID=43655 RepID=A0AAD4AMJ5_9GAMM|nr:hypothetical protein PCIT_a1620 [Pseudoalteromonas citrea]